ncbi:hypothetical protein TNCT_606891 [Trichonephila clavata]|uniref:Uncharacterized protein n=1 Tax=Trichonephila clavata TaxID=2740835 RepID=A0A8X6G285_TRICU|nr:hypothetical protein TNCT_606891 [Trichonephila clavata]
MAYDLASPKKVSEPIYGLNNKCQSSERFGSFLNIQYFYFSHDWHLSKETAPSPGRISSIGAVKLIAISFTCAFTPHHPFVCRGLGQMKVKNFPMGIRIRNIFQRFFSLLNYSEVKRLPVGNPSQLLKFFFLT